MRAGPYYDAPGLTMSWRGSCPNLFPSRCHEIKARDFNKYAEFKDANMFRFCQNCRKVSLVILRVAAYMILLSSGLAPVPVSAQNERPFESPSQSTPGATGGTSIPKPPPTFQASGSSGIRRHKDLTGGPCLNVSGYARPFTTNPHLYDHMITAVNKCPQRIAIHVCYYQSQNCIAMEIPGDTRKDAVLGTMPADKSFRFEFREKFATQ